MGFLVPTFITGSLGLSRLLYSETPNEITGEGGGEHVLTAQKVCRNGHLRLLVLRAIEVNGFRTSCPENFSQCIRPVVAKVCGEDLDFRREIRGHCALGSLLEFGDRVHKSPSDVEWCHADVDVKHDLSKGGTSGGVESLEGEKHLTKAILTILFRREKVTVLAGSNCHVRGVPLDDEVKGRDEGLEIPLPLSQVGVTIAVQGRVSARHHKREDKVAYLVSSSGSKVAFKVISTL